MKHLLDTNVLSELVRAAPHPNVVAWFEAADEDSLFVSVLTIGEIRTGIRRLPSGSRRDRLDNWVDVALPSRFGARMLSVDLPVAERWATIQADAGRTLPAIDSILAATALRHSLCLVTRNVKDFQISGLNVLNPWEHMSGA